MEVSLDCCDNYLCLGPKLKSPTYYVKALGHMVLSGHNYQFLQVCPILAVYIQSECPYQPMLHTC